MASESEGHVENFEPPSAGQGAMRPPVRPKLMELNMEGNGLWRV